MKKAMKKRLALLLASTLLVGVAGCSRNIDSTQSKGDKPESGSASASNQPEESAPSVPVIDFASDGELHRDILVNFGADVTTGINSKPLEAHNGASLFLREDWDAEQPLEGFNYFVWNFGQMWNEDITIEERQTKYAHPSGKDNMGYFFPRTLYEDRAQQYFDVSLDELRSISEYDDAKEGYNMQAGFGMGGVPQIELRRVEQQEDILELYLTLVYTGTEPARSENKVLRMRMAEDSSYKYIAYATEGVSVSANAADETAVFARGHTTTDSDTGAA